MIGKAFPIDFVRQVIEQTLLEEHIKNPHFFGGKNQVNLFSFYEQLQKEDEVNRYVEIYRDLADQQNRTGLIMNGTIIAPENPTITNLYNCTIIPMSFTCSFRVNIGDRDSAIETINNLISILKGRKQDIALFENGQLFKVGTIGNNIGAPDLNIGDYIGSYQLSTLNTDIEAFIDSLEDMGLGYQISDVLPRYYYVSIDNQLKVALYNSTTQTWNIVVDDGTQPNIVFPPSHSTFQKYKISMSFDSIRCDEPFNLNADEYVTISFGGSATLVSKDVSFGNDLVKVSFAKYKIIADTPIVFSNQTPTYLEPLEQPSGNNANTRINQLISNNFVSNTHTDSIGVSIQYSFVLDKSISLIKQWWKYARYGKQGTLANNYNDGVTPNMIYTIVEANSSWGVYEQQTIKARIVESIDIENTESDVESITIPFQVQGDND